jgi:hypothetical protein
MFRPRKTNRLLTAGSLALLAATSSGCATWYHDQIEVPGTNHRIVVGSDNWPTKKIWLLVDGKEQKLNVVHAEEKKQ